MDKFDKIIKQKVERFEVPYNDAHWAEMNGKLNAIRIAKIKNVALSIVGGLSILGAIGYTFLDLGDNRTTIDREISLNDNYFKENSPPEESHSQLQNEAIIEIPGAPSTSESTLVETTEQKSDDDNNEGFIIEEKDEEKFSSLSESTSDKEDKLVSNNNLEQNLKKEEALNPKFIIYNNRVCSGESVSFQALSASKEVSYLWDFGDGYTSKRSNPSHIYTEDGTYDVTLTLTSKKTGKSVDHVEKNSVIIFPKPVADFDYAEVSLSKDRNKLKYPYTNFTSKYTEDKMIYLWVFGNGETSTSPNTKTVYKEKGSFDVMLTITSSEGCYDSKSKKVEIKQEFNLYAPDAFSPNGNGSNESFIPKALLGWDVQFEMLIKDKIGKIIHSTTDRNQPWNGKMNNSGISLEEGVYFWQVTTYDAEGAPHVHLGRVHLIK